MQLSLPEGQSLKSAGQDLVAGHNEEFVSLMRAEAMRISNGLGYVTSDDLRVYAARIGLEPSHPNAWGAVFKGKGWRSIGYRKSAVPQSHARIIRIWQYVAQDATE